MPVRTRVKPLDPVAWAKSAKRRQGGVPCSLCSCSDAVRAIKAWIPLWRAGAIMVSHTQASDWLNANTAWKGAVGQFRRCLKSHHGYSAGG